MSDEHRHVRHRDVMPFAKPRCRTCFGKGEFTKVLSSTKIEKGVPVRETTRRDTLCGCALQRFMRAHWGQVTTLKDGALVWVDPPKPQIVPVPPGVSIAYDPALTPEAIAEIRARAEKAGVRVLSPEDLKAVAAARGAP